MCVEINDKQSVQQLCTTRVSVGVLMRALNGYDNGKYHCSILFRQCTVDLWLTPLVTFSSFHCKKCQMQSPKYTKIPVILTNDADYKISSPIALAGINRKLLLICICDPALFIDILWQNSPTNWSESSTTITQTLLLSS